MSKYGKSDFKELRNLQKNLEKLNQQQVDLFMEACAKELAARLLAKVIKRTPVRKPEDCPPGVKGGTLRRGWTTQANGSGAEGMKSNGASQYVDTLKIHHFGNTYVIEIVNPVDYASYVEFGHRTANHKGWVKGQFMLTISEQEIENAAPAILEKKLMKLLGECFND